MSWRKGARRPVARQQKAAVTGLLRPQGRVLTTMRSSPVTFHTTEISPQTAEEKAEGNYSREKRPWKAQLSAQKTKAKGQALRSRQGSNLRRGDPNGFQVHRLNLSATTTPMTNCGPPAPLAAGGQHRAPPASDSKSS
ncbi:hypothetical protein G5714_024563 [Onychostoma macrolepis]|uniref:Uncharacterized protein n=1 Tax=Onychostoma macrolepis TaxID=369639 RepID=A0A7J6BI44_9TELE|nr:hypothetical protein G5714_024563 [Onychostoma macrolepis]